MKLKKCLHCGAIVEVLNDAADKNVFCCGELMVEVLPNSVDAAAEKHVPAYEVNGDKITASVNHVMEEDHFIEWIALETDDDFKKVKLKIGEDAKAEFPYVPGSKLYAYCNKHELWSAEVK